MPAAPGNDSSIAAGVQCHAGACAGNDRRHRTERASNPTAFSLPVCPTGLPIGTLSLGPSPLSLGLGAGLLLAATLVDPRIPILIAAHRPRMLRIAARYADQWDTFGAIPSTATAGVEAELGERIAQLDGACREIGRDPAEIRRSTWATNEVLRSVDAYREFVGRHARLGFTDFTTVLPAAGDQAVLRSVAQDVIPEIRARGALDLRAVTPLALSAQQGDPQWRFPGDSRRRANGLTGSCFLRVTPLDDEGGERNDCNRDQPRRKQPVWVSQL
jgi:hypothetical protein